MRQIPPYNVARLNRRLQMGSRHTMGDVAEILALYGPQLEEFRVQLYDLYTKKADLLAAREAARFKYLTNWFARFKTVFSNFKTAVFETGDSNLIGAAKLVFQNYGGGYLKQLPITDMSGKLVSFNLFDQSVNLQPQGSLAITSIPVNGVYKQVSFLSPVEDLFVVPANPNSDKQEPVALDYKQNINNILMQMDSLFREFPSSGKPNPYTGVGTIDYNEPREWIRSLLGYAQYGEVALRDSTATNLANIFKASGLADILAEGFDLYKDVIKKTVLLINNFYAIKDTEKSVIDFLSSYQGLDASTRNLVISDILKELQDFSKIEMLKATQNLQQTAPAATTTAVTTPAVTTTPAATTQVPTETKKSKTGLLVAAAAAAGLLLLNRE